MARSDKAAMGLSSALRSLKTQVRRV